MTSTLKQLDSVMENVEKHFGQGSIVRLGSKRALDVPSISTACTALDEALGCGGYPKGRIVEIYGPESSGKTTLALHAIAECQRAGGTAAFVDAEHALDPSYAAALGVQSDQLLLSQPDSGEQALDIVDMLVRSEQISLIVVDSVAALVPRAELEGEMGDHHVGLQARLMSQALRKLNATVHKTNTCIIFINQLRSKIGVSFGSPETTTGGNALKYYASVRLDVRRIGAVKSGDENVGNRTRVKIAKNKLAPPFRRVEFDIRYGTGIDNTGTLIDLALEHGALQKNGSWMQLGDNNLAQGRERLRDLMLSDANTLKQIEQALELARPDSDASKSNADDAAEATNSNDNNSTAARAKSASSKRRSPKSHTSTAKAA